MATMEARVPTAEKAPAPLVPQGVEAPHDVVKEKSVISPHPVPTPLEKLDVSKAPPSPPLADKIPDPPGKRTSLGPTDRDVALAQVEKEKSLSFIKAWEESEKTKVDNK
ncbi:hypothetical protein C3L33_07992, partial [Rhododendron williamsianum]